jgi:hypothetical protein
MWKMLVAFIIFAAIALTVVFKAGDKADMQGEAGGHDQTEHAAPATPNAPTGSSSDMAPGGAPAAPAAAAAPEGDKK